MLTQPKLLIRMGSTDIRFIAELNLWHSIVCVGDIPCCWGVRAVWESEGKLW